MSSPIIHTMPTTATSGHSLLVYGTLIPIVILAVYGLIRFGTLITGWLRNRNGARGISSQMTSTVNPFVLPTSQKIQHPRATYLSSNLSTTKDLERNMPSPPLQKRTSSKASSRPPHLKPLVLHYATDINRSHSATRGAISRPVISPTAVSWFHINYKENEASDINPNSSRVNAGQTPSAASALQPHNSNIIRSPSSTTKEHCAVTATDSLSKFTTQTSPKGVPKRDDGITIPPPAGADIPLRKLATPILSEEKYSGDIYAPRPQTDSAFVVVQQATWKGPKNWTDVKRTSDVHPAEHKLTAGLRATVQSHRVSLVVVNGHKHDKENLSIDGDATYLAQT